MESIEDVLKWLLEATRQIGAEYFQLPVANREDPIYRERVYCYELYFRWRSQWPNDSSYSLCGEVDKVGHPVITRGEKPDFLVHVPGLMDNLLVVEVKAGNASWQEVLEDLRKLSRYRRTPINYQHALFLIYGINLAEWRQVFGRIAGALLPDDEFDPSLISVILHSTAGEPAEVVGFN